MKGELQSRRILVRGQEVFIGVDVHKESWHVTARTEGEEVFHGGIPSQYHVFRKLLDRFKDCRWSFGGLKILASPNSDPPV